MVLLATNDFDEFHKDITFQMFFAVNDGSQKT